MLNVAYYRMPFFDTFDQDKILNHVLPRLFTSLNSWRRGMAADETALMNRITSEFNNERSRRCDIGKTEPFHVVSHLFELHRKGPKQVDQYGSDLAVTVTAPEFTKTVFFQFKVAKDGIAKIEYNQIEDAKKIDLVYDRAFMFIVDPVSRLIRLQSIDKLEASFNGQKSMGFHIDEGENFSEWLLNWFRCERGKATAAEDVHKVEDLLRMFSIASEIESMVEGWDLPADYLPAKSWLETKITPV